MLISIINIAVMGDNQYLLPLYISHFPFDALKKN